MLEAAWGKENVGTSGYESISSFGSVNGAASGAECRAVSGTNADIDSGSVDFVGSEAVSITISGLVGDTAPVADKGISVVEPDAVPRAIHDTLSPGTGGRAFSKLFDSTAPSAAGTAAPFVELSSEITDGLFSGAHCAIVEGARPAGEYLVAAGISACWSWLSNLGVAAIDSV